MAVQCQIQSFSTWGLFSLEIQDVTLSNSLRATYQQVLLDLALPSFSGRASPLGVCGERLITCRKAESTVSLSPFAVTPSWTHVLLICCLLLLLLPPEGTWTSQPLLPSPHHKSLLRSVIVRVDIRLSSMSSTLLYISPAELLTSSLLFPILGSIFYTVLFYQ